MSSKKVLVLEGPNGIGKDIIINKILEYCPQYNIHYADSAILKCPVININPSDLNLISMVTYGNIRNGINRLESTNSCKTHIQYRSPITNMVYNPLYHPNEEWTKHDRVMCENFIEKYYDKDYTISIFLYSKEYLEKLMKSFNKEKRVRDTEFLNIDRINSLYFEIASSLISSKDSNKFNTSVVSGEGYLDLLSFIDSEIEEQIFNKFFSEFSLAFINTSYLLDYIGDKIFEISESLGVVLNTKEKLSKEKIIDLLKTDVRFVCNTPIIRITIYEIVEHIRKSGNSDSILLFNTKIVNQNIMFVYRELFNSCISDTQYPDFTIVPCLSEYNVDTKNPLSVLDDFCFLYTANILRKKYKNMFVIDNELNLLNFERIKNETNN